MDKVPENTGLIQNPWDPRDVWADEIVGATQEAIPSRFLIEELVFEPQNDYPFCAAMSVSKAFEWHMKQVGIQKELSKTHLFFQAGGGPTGSYFRANLNVASNKGCIEESKLPMPTKENTPENFEHYRKTAMTVPFDDAYVAPGYARIVPDEVSLKKAIMQYGPLIVGVYAGGVYWSPSTARQGETDNHACLLVGWDSTHWFLFDSLKPFANFTGYHTVSRSYTFNSAFAFMPMPEGWKQKVEAQRIPGNAERYGKQRVFQAEIDAGYLIKNALERFVSKPVMDYAGRRWIEYINAAVYGGWTITDSHPVWKWKKVPGDIVREAEFHYLTKGGHLFDFSQPKV